MILLRSNSSFDNFKEILEGIHKERAKISDEYSINGYFSKFANLAVKFFLKSMLPHGYI